MIELAAIPSPDIDWAGLSPIATLLFGSVIVFAAGLIGGERTRSIVVPLLTLVALAAAAGLSIWQWGDNTDAALGGARKLLIEGAVVQDDLALMLNFIFCATGAAAVLLAWREPAVRMSGHGEFFGLLLASIGGMALLAGAENLVTLFLGLELLSIPLYVLCASAIIRPTSLESGLKYLIIGSVGSATLLFGLAMIYGATGATDFDAIGAGIAKSGVFGDPLLLTGIALSVAGLAFKASAAPFHQWTPDVYQGAPTPVTAFMAVATKAAALAIFLRFFTEALILVQPDWSSVIAVLATVTIVVGNVGALGQSSLKRMLAYSGVAQAGYLLAGVVVGTTIGAEALVFYLAVYLFMNLAAFAVIVARERETPYGDDMRAVTGLGATRPLLAAPMTIAMLSLAGIPGTAGFIGKFFLIDASVAGDFTWLAVVIVLGSAVSLGYYLRVIALMWMTPAPTAAEAPRGPTGQPAMAGGAPESDTPRGQPEVYFVALLAGAATLVFGIIPSPLFELAKQAGAVLGLS